MPSTARIGRKISLLFVPLLPLIATSAEAQCTQTSSISQWRCWEQSITSSVNFYAAGAGNPYRDLTLRIHFADSISGSNFDQDAFWAADTNQPKLFKVRAALPAGNWTWSIAGCSGTNGGSNCASGVTWTPASGPITGHGVDLRAPDLLAGISNSFPSFLTGRPERRVRLFLTHLQRPFPLFLDR